MIVLILATGLQYMWLFPQKCRTNSRCVHFAVRVTLTIRVTVGVSRVKWEMRDGKAVCVSCPR